MNSQLFYKKCGCPKKLCILKCGLLNKAFDYVTCSSRSVAIGEF